MANIKRLKVFKGSERKELTMTKDFTIRRATMRDAKAIYEVLFAAFEEYRDYYTPEAFADTVLSEEAAKTRLNKLKVFVAIDQEKKVIGTIGWKKIGKEEGHIRGMAVHPVRQGKNSPAAALLYQVEEDACSVGCSIITLDTTEVLKRAQRFYQKHGYIQTGKIGDYFGMKIYGFAKKISK